MALANRTDLLASAAAWMNRTDLTSVLPDCVTLCEATLQVRCKILEFETTATVVITNGVGTLPTDFAGMRSVYWDDSNDRPLQYITPEQFDNLRDWGQGEVYFYTISGTTIRTTNTQTGNVVLTYNAKFVPLSVGFPTNSLLTNFPDAYLYGTLVQAALYVEDDPKVQKYGALFDRAIDRVNANNEDRKYAGATLQVRAQ